MFALHVLCLGLVLVSTLSSTTVVSAFCPTKRAFVRKCQSDLKTTETTNFELFPDDLPERGGKSRGISSTDLRRMNQARRQRIQEEQDLASQFVSGDELHLLRQKMLGLRQELAMARQTKANTRVQELERSIIKAQKVDAEFVYEVSLSQMQSAEYQGRVKEAEEYRKEAMRARKALPQFNLDGLWVGKYGNHGFEMINVTYAGDVLIAYKVTGDKNVPKGEITFTVDLGAEAGEMILEPIELGERSSRQWGSRFLSRFAGTGQVASSGFVNKEWMDGQLILVNEYFSFAWLPITHQVFFGRPSAELTLKLLRESKSDNIFADDKLRQHLSRCMEETHHLEDEMEVNDGLFDSHNQEDYYQKQGCFE
jgi:hypothetical protein